MTKKGAHHGTLILTMIFYNRALNRTIDIIITKIKYNIHAYMYKIKTNF